MSCALGFDVGSKLVGVAVGNAITGSARALAVVPVRDGQPDWAALARTGLTLVIYMGVARAAHITAQLLAAGLRAELPAAIVSAAHTAQQRHAVTTLAGLPDCIAREGLKSPALLVIGEVAAHATATLVLPEVMTG